MLGWEGVSGHTATRIEKKISPSLDAFNLVWQEIRPLKLEFKKRNSHDDDRITDRKKFVIKIPFPLSAPL